jgi:DNA-binding CsgD family transcriptional regulator
MSFESATFSLGLAQALLGLQQGRVALATRALEATVNARVDVGAATLRDALLGICALLDGDEEKASGLSRLAVSAARHGGSSVVPMERRNVEIALALCVALDVALGRRYVASRTAAALKRSRLDAVRSLVAVALDGEQGTPGSALADLGGYAAIVGRLRRLRSASRLPLTGTEARILRLMTEGRTTKEIASELGRSPNTVRNHTAAVLQKLGAKSRIEAIALAAEHVTI